MQQNHFGELAHEFSPPRQLTQKAVAHDMMGHIEQLTRHFSKLCHDNSDEMEHEDLVS